MVLKALITMGVGWRVLIRDLTQIAQFGQGGKRFCQKQTAYIRASVSPSVFVSVVVSMLRQAQQPHAQRPQ